MADSTIAGLALATTVSDADEFEKNEAGTSKKLTGALLKAYFGDSIANQSTADQTPAAATLTYLAGSNLAIPAGKMRVGTVFKWRFFLTKTAAGTLASTFDVRVGTAGTTADTSRLSFTTDAGTAVVDTAWIDLTVTCRGPLSASGIFVGTIVVSHDLAITGFGTKAVRVQNVVSSAFDVTAASLIVGVSVTTGTSQAWTFKQVVAEAKNL